MKKQIFAAGFVALLTVAASAQKKKQPPPPPEPPAAMKMDVPPPPPPPPPPALTDDEIAELPKDYQDFLSRNPSVGSVHWNNNAIFIVPKKGKVERYVLNEKGLAEAEAKYGKLPAAPPPPPKPPKPPVAPKEE